MEQIDLANRLGRKSSSSVSEWERGKYTPKAGVLNDISRIFNVSLSELMTKDLSDTSSPRTDNPADDIDKIIDRAMFFDGKPLTDDDRRALRGIISGYMNSKGD